jgi:hypothetical protein
LARQWWGLRAAGRHRASGEEELTIGEKVVCPPIEISGGMVGVARVDDEQGGERWEHRWPRWWTRKSVVASGGSSTKDTSESVDGYVALLEGNPSHINTLLSISRHIKSYDIYIEY